MEAFPPEYVEHNLPSILLSGLGEQPDQNGDAKFVAQSSGTPLNIISESCRGERAELLRDQLLELDGSQRAWNASSLPGPTGVLRYRMKPIGRTWTLPSRKAAPLPQSPGTESPPGAPRSTELHSPLSPLSPGSPIFGDGIMTPLWFAKHQSQVPALIIAFFDFSAADSIAQAERIQSDINNVRTALGRSGYKTRFAAVLLSEQSILHAPELEERLTSIRRATGLDPKSGLFFMPPMSSKAEIATFVRSMMTTLQPAVVEHYRELTKHARRKKARGGPAPSVALPLGGSSQLLSTPGWNVRYETKQGVFAEFRQEMDAAERHYSAAIEELFSAEGAFETTPSWSPRFDQARLLCDSLAVRILRCQLWNQLTSGAALSWVNYRARMKDLIDQRGKGSQTYSWDAWEARWAEIMAQLIQRAALPIFASHARPADSSELAVQQVYALPEATMLNIDRLPPFQLLHHPGYWLSMAVVHTRSRREKALAIPEEDRTPPGQSPASAVASRSRNYDAYLVPDPHEESPLPGGEGYDHLTEISRLTDDAVEHFRARAQVRATEGLRLRLAQDFFDTEQYAKALAILTPVWDASSWRRDDWNDLHRDALSLIHQCALHERDDELLVATTWELLAIDTPEPVSDLNRLDRTLTEEVALKVTDKQRRSPIDVHFAFCEQTSHVGDPVECQVMLTYPKRFNDRPPMTLSGLEVVLGSGKTITIQHQPGEAKTDIERYADLTSPSAQDTIKANLTVHAGETVILSFNATFREALDVRLESIAIFVKTDKISLEHRFLGDRPLQTRSMYLERHGVLERRRLPFRDSLAMTVLPKPPKLQVSVASLHEPYYTDEPITLPVQLANGEVEAVQATAELVLDDAASQDLYVRWNNATAVSSKTEVGRLDAGESRALQLHLLAPSESQKRAITLEVRYHLLLDPGTTLLKSVTLDFDFVSPFEATFAVTPQLHDAPWPSYLSPPKRGKGDDPTALGISHLWRLNAHLRTGVTGSLHIYDMKCIEHDLPADAHFTIHPSDNPINHILTAHAPLDHPTTLSTQKLSLDDRSPTFLELSLQLTWSRDPSSPKITTTLPIPRLTMPSSEPRVLCTSSGLSSLTDALSIHYHLENPSLHFLTFALTMEANEDFAFSGAKYRTLSLAPMSRVRVDYWLVFHDGFEGDGEKERWTSPVLQVVDLYYQKNLKVHAAGRGVEGDGKGGVRVRVAALDKS